MQVRSRQTAARRVEKRAFEGEHVLGRGLKIEENL